MSLDVTRASLVAGGLLGAAAVALGAFGAHGLKSVLDAAGQAVNWETASRYALVHATALLATGLFAALPGGKHVSRVLAAAAWCFFVGAVVFSGCLWLLAVSGIRALGAVVPAGGVLLIAGWLLLALGGLRLASESGPAADQRPVP